MQRNTIHNCIETTFRHANSKVKSMGQALLNVISKIKNFENSLNGLYTYASCVANTGHKNFDT